MGQNGGRKQMSNLGDIKLRAKGVVRFFVQIVFLATILNMSFADIYEWKDEMREIFFTDNPGSLPKKTRDSSTKLNERANPARPASESLSLPPDSQSFVYPKKYKRRLEVPNGTGWTSLHIAAGNGDVQEVKRLLDAGADIEGRTDLGSTSFYEAARRGKLEVLRLLQKYGADINARILNGVTPLIVASEYKQAETVKYLIQQEVDMEAETLMKQQALGQVVTLTWHGDFQIAKILVDNGADIEHRDAIGCTPLKCAVTSGHTKLVAYLLSQGANSNTKSDTGEPPLWAASYFNHIEITRLLLRYGANPDIDNNGETSLYLAASKNHIAIAGLLLKYGANPNISHTDITPLYMAASQNHIAINWLLLKHGANPNIPYIDNTPLYMVASKNHIAINWLLLKYGADPEISTRKGWTPLSLAKWKGHYAIGAMLEGALDK